MVAGLGAVAGAALSGLLGCAVTTAIWVAQTPEGARRALRWGILNGVLIGAAGILTGALAALAATALAARLPTLRHAAGLGAAIGAVIGAGLGASLWGEAAGGPVAFASLWAHTVAGALVASVAETRARRARAAVAAGG